MNILSFPCDFPIGYQLFQRGEKPEWLLIALHGYRQDSDFFRTKLEGIDNAWILLPNAPLPIPEFKGSEIELGYAWYLFDPKAQRFVFDMELALGLLERLVVRLGLEALPTRIVGFSQGGYLAPYLGRRLPRTEQIIGIHSRFREEDFLEPLNFRLDALHGAEDKLVDPTRARECHTTLIARGNRGEFKELPGVGHQFTEEVRVGLVELLGKK